MSIGMGEWAADPLLADQAAVELFNSKFRVGTPVRFWTGSTQDRPRQGETCERAIRLGGGAAVVRVDEFVTNQKHFIALTHVEVMTSHVSSRSNSSYDEVGS